MILHYLSHAWSAAKPSLSQFWDGYKPACIAAMGAVGGLTLSEWSILLGFFSALLGVLYAGSKLIWGWVDWFQKRERKRKKDVQS